MAWEEEGFRPLKNAINLPPTLWSGQLTFSQFYVNSGLCKPFSSLSNQIVIPNFLCKGMQEFSWSINMKKMLNLTSDEATTN